MVRAARKDGPLTDVEFIALWVRLELICTAVANLRLQAFLDRSEELANLGLTVLPAQMSKSISVPRMVRIAGLLRQVQQELDR